MRSFFDGRDFQIRWDLLPDSKEERKFIEWLLGPAFLSSIEMDNEHFLKRIFPDAIFGFKDDPESLGRLYEKIYDRITKSYAAWKRMRDERVEIERSIGE
jgi:hypothetical protein